MSEIIAICGLICTECPTYLATQKNDDDERQKVAEQWSKLFKMKIEPDDINCDGCLSESERHFNYCTVCKIRQCGKGKGVQNCAYCAFYAYCAKVVLCLLCLLCFFVLVPKLV